MKRKIFILLILLSSLLYGQETLPNHYKGTESIVLINNALGSLKMIEKKFGDNDSLTVNKYIKKIEIHKYKNSKDGHLNNYPKLFENSVISIDLKKKLKFETISQKQINILYNLDQNTNVYYNGILIFDKNYNINIDAILKVELINKNNTNNLNSDVVNIWTKKPKT